MEDNKIYLLDENGNEKEYEFLTTLEVDNDSFIVYTDNEKYGEDKTIIYIKKIISNIEEGNLEVEDIDEDVKAKVFEALSMEVNE